MADTPNISKVDAFLDYFNNAYFEGNFPIQFCNHCDTIGSINREIECLHPIYFTRRVKSKISNKGSLNRANLRLKNTILINLDLNSYTHICLKIGQKVRSLSDRVSSTLTAGLRPQQIPYCG